MIPLKLQIKNFLSYGPTQTIDFTPYNLICLSGKNGHGKSALLDAITWAIWGQARKISNTSKADEGLLKLGQSQMFVALDFSCNEQIYRIKREYTVINGKATANLDFAVALEKDQYRALSDKTIKQTQEKIEQVIGLTYEAFVNSAFLKQGQSNEFSKKSAKERKEILANILGLEKFELMKKKAADKVRELSFTFQNIKKIQDHLKNEILGKDNLKIELQETLKKSQSLIDQENNLKINFAQLADTKKSLLEKIHIQKINQFKFNDLETKIEEKKQLFLSSVQNYRSYLRQTKKFKNSIEIDQEKNRIENELEKLQNTAQNKIILEKDILELKAKLQTQFSKLQNESQEHQTKLKLEINSLESDIKNNKEKIQELTNLKFEYETYFNNSEVQIKKLNEKLITAQNINDRFLSLEKILERKKTFYQKFIAMGNAVANNIKDCEKKETLIGTELKSCPLCNQKLEHDNKEHFVLQIKKQKNHYEHQFARMSKVVKNLKTNILEIHKEYESIKIILNEKTLLEKDLQDINKNYQKKLTDHKLINEKIAQLNLNLTELDNILKLKIEALQKFENAFINTTNPEILNLKNQISEKEKIISTLAFNVETIESLKNKIKELNLLLQNSNIGQLKDFKQNIHNLCTEIKLQKKELIKLKVEISQLEFIEKEYQQIENQEKELVRTLEELVKNKEFLIRTKGALEQQETVFAKYEKEHEKNEQELKLIEADIEDYQILNVALSKDGIQALLIEDAIPEIEHDANLILSKLTDNQSQIIVESLRDLKSGGTKETLDIKISDPAGIRSYEMFSGGEAFRIDFALRIAISKLLAKRAGTALETLIIDEGFGSQDEEGLSNIMDMIHKIQDYFAKIIIVSHLPILKEQFPAHFVISKGSTGSTVKTIENG
ncbi:SMC family ATPase [Candidatus Dependentiae bacterium]|nr:SMC family ATPase [Candidatus Dependentiae bacterium]